MMLTLRRLAESDVEALLKDPDEVVPLLRDVDGVEGVAAAANQRAMEKAIAAIGHDSWSRYLAAEEAMRPHIAAALVEHLQANPPPEVSRPEYLDLDKSWHILHTLISGSPDPANTPEAALLGGEELGPCGGYGPVRLLRAEQVSAFAEVLDGLEVETLKERLDPKALKAQGVTFAQTDFDLEMVHMEVEDHYPALKKFIKVTANKKRALLLILE